MPHGGRHLSGDADRGSRLRGYRRHLSQVDADAAGSAIRILVIDALARADCRGRRPGTASGSGARPPPLTRECGLSRRFRRLPLGLGQARRTGGTRPCRVAFRPGPLQWRDSHAGRGDGWSALLTNTCGLIMCSSPSRTARPSASVRSMITSTDIPLSCGDISREQTRCPASASVSSSRLRQSSDIAIRILHNDMRAFRLLVPCLQCGHLVADVIRPGNAGVNSGRRNTGPVASLRMPLLLSCLHACTTRRSSFADMEAPIGPDCASQNQTFCARRKAHGYDCWQRQSRQLCSTF